MAKATKTPSTPPVAEPVDDIADEVPTDPASPDPHASVADCIAATAALFQ